MHIISVAITKDPYRHRPDASRQASVDAGLTRSLQVRDSSSTQFARQVQGLKEPTFDDGRWLAQVADLRRDLRTETGALQLSTTTRPGTKGTLDALVLALGSAGAFSTMVDLLRAWLGRDKTRTVVASWIDGRGCPQEVVLSAEHADPATLAPLVEAVARKIGAPS